MERSRYQRLERGNVCAVACENCPWNGCTADKTQSTATKESDFDMEDSGYCLTLCEQPLAFDFLSNLRAAQSVKTWRL